MGHRARQAIMVAAIAAGSCALGIGIGSHATSRSAESNIVPRPTSAPWETTTTETSRSETAANPEGDLELRDRHMEALRQLRASRAEAAELQRALESAMEAVVAYQSHVDPVTTEEAYLLKGYYWAIGEKASPALHAELMAIDEYRELGDLLLGLPHAGF